MRERILVVEDEALVALAIEEVLAEAGYVVCGIADAPEEALVLARRHRPDLAVVDVRLAGGGDGIVLAEQLAAGWGMRILFATGNAGEVRRRAHAGQGCLSKPFEAEWLLASVRAVADGESGLEIPGYVPLSFVAGR